MFREPRNMVRQYVQKIDALRVKMAHGVELRRKACAQDVRRLESQLRALSPLAVLDRGFSITRGAGGAIVRSADDVGIGESLETQVARGVLESKVVSKKRGGAHGGKAK
jgi:exodeoxyribonuclease VII large subunit